MDETTASLIIKVDSDGVATANERLDGTPRSADKAQKATDGLVARIKALVLAYVSVQTAVRLANKLFEQTTAIQKYEAQLETATGSIVKARIALTELRDVEQGMIFELNQVTEAFTDLTNLGLDGGRRALIAYGNIAAAFNKDLGSITAAVTQASTGQFRALQQLGIKVAETNDGLSLSFRGTTTNIAKDANEIQKYLIALGENQFADAMTKRMMRLEGATKNLSGAWDDLFIAISEKGGAEFLATGIRRATSAIEELTAMIASGQLSALLEATSGKFRGWGTDAETSVDLISDALREGTEGWEGEINGFVTFFMDAMKNLPENVRFTMQAAGAGFAFLTEAVSATVVYLWERFSITFDQIVGAAVITGKQVANALNPFASTDFNFTEEITKLAAETTDRLTNSTNKYAAAIRTGGEATAETIDFFLTERDAAVASFDAQVAGAKRLRAEYEANRQAAQAARGANEPLQGLTGSSNSGPKPIITNQDIAAFETLRNQLQLAEKSIEESYKRRQALIIQNTEEGSALRFQLEESLEAQITAEYAQAARDRFDTAVAIQEELNAAIGEGRLFEIDSLRSQLEFEEQMMQDSYLNRRQQILEDTELTERERLDALTRNEAAYTARQRQLELQRTKMVLNNSQQLFESLANIAEQSVGDQNNIYKAAFAASKAFAIADSIIKIQQGIASAAANPFPANIAAMASVAAATAGIISNITETVLAFEHGGMISAGRYGLVGETGRPELVRGPAMVTSARTTADLMQGGGRGGSGRTTVNVYNQAGVEVAVEERETDEGKVIDLMIKRVETKIASDIQRGGNRLSKAFESTYNMRRGIA